jgi:predicted amidohydrolase
VENGFHFIGHSKIVAPTGKPVAAAGNKETTLIADIDPAVARVKRNIVIPGKYETEVFKSRRPDLYQLS